MLLHAVAAITDKISKSQAKARAGNSVSVKMLQLPVMAMIRNLFSQNNLFMTAKAVPELVIEHPPRSSMHAIAVFIEPSLETHNHWSSL